MRFVIETINPARHLRRYAVEHVFVHAGYRQYGNCNSDAINTVDALDATDEDAGITAQSVSVSWRLLHREK